jgi:hypothetical protein
MLVVHQGVEVSNKQPQQPRTLAGDSHCCCEGVALLAIVLLDVIEQRSLALQHIAQHMFGLQPDPSTSQRAFCPLGKFPVMSTQQT